MIGNSRTGLTGLHRAKEPIGPFGSEQISIKPLVERQMPSEFSHEHPRRRWPGETQRCVPSFGPDLEVDGVEVALRLEP